MTPSVPTALLAALLLTAPAAAQTQVQPNSSQSGSSQASPPAQAAAPASPVLRVSAPLGASLESAVTTTTLIRLSGLTVGALPGSAVPEAKLNQIRRDLGANLGRAGQTLTLRGKAFVRVTGRSADGAATLTSTVVQGLPGEKPVTLSFTQDVAPTGEVSTVKIDSDSPPLRALLATFTPERLRQFAGENGQELTGFYGRPLVPGTSQTTTRTLDPQSLLSSVLGAMATEENADELFSQMAATPLTVKATSTYQGTTPQGLHSFRLGSTYGEWQITAGGQIPLPTVTVTLDRVTQTGTQLFRRDGLPGASTNTLSMVMTVSMAMDGVQVGLTLTLEQRAASTPR